MKKILRIESSESCLTVYPEDEGDAVCSVGITIENDQEICIALLKSLIPLNSQFTQQQLQIEFNFLQARRITIGLLEIGWITGEEFKRIMAENIRTFPTFLAPLL